MKTNTLNSVRSRVAPINRVLAFEYAPLITRLVSKHGLNKKEAEELFLDCKKFLYVCATSDEIAVPSERIDFVWHAWLLFTRDYSSFCRRFLGRFIHHLPAEAASQKPRGRQRSKRVMIESTLIAAQTVFGPLSKNWEFPELRASCIPCSEGCAASTNCQDD